MALPDPRAPGNLSSLPLLAARRRGPGGRISTGRRSPSGASPCSWVSPPSCSSHSVVSDSRDPMDCSAQDSSVHGILQARVLEWVAIPFCRGSSLSRDQTGSALSQADSSLTAAREAPVAVPRAAHRPGAILQHRLQVSAILHVAGEGAGHRLGAPVLPKRREPSSSRHPPPQRSKRCCLAGGRSPQQNSAQACGRPCCSRSPPTRAPRNSFQPSMPARLPTHAASRPRCPDPGSQHSSERALVCYIT